MFRIIMILNRHCPAALNGKTLMKTNLKNRRTEILSVVVLLLLICLWFFRGMVFRNEVFITADALCDFYPWDSTCQDYQGAKNGLMSDSIITFLPAYTFTARWVSSGHVPLWNPHILCGTPAAASGVTGLFYPLSFPFYLANKPVESFGWGTFAHLFLGGFFMFLMLRVLGVEIFGATLGGVIFCFCGWTTAWLLLPSFIHSAIWLPLMICLYEISIKRKSVYPALLAGVAGAMPFLAGQVQVAAYSHLFLAGYAAFRTATTKDFRIKTATFWGITCIVAAALASVQILLTLELMGASQREVASSFTKIMSSPLNMKHLILGFLPNFYGDPINNNFWGEHNYVLFCHYTGIAPAILAIAAIIKSKGKTKWFFFAAAVVAMMLALGSPLNMLLMFVPGLNRIPSPRILYLYTFSITVLAGMGFDAIAKFALKRKAGILIPVAVFLGIFILYFVIACRFETARLAGLLNFEKNSVIEFMIYVVIISSCIAAFKNRKPIFFATMILAVLLDIGIWSKWFNPTVEKKYVYPETKSVNFLLKDDSLFRVHGSGVKWAFVPNSSMYYGLNDVRGIESLYISRYYDIVRETARKNFGIDSIIANTPSFYGYYAPIISMLNVKYILSDVTVAPEDINAKFVQMYDSTEMKISINKMALPRFYAMGSGWNATSTDSEILDAITSPGFNPLMDLYLDASDIKGIENLLPDENSDAGIQAAAIKVTDYTPDDVKINVNTNRNIILTSSEANFTGWKAFVDDKRVPIITANYHFRAIPVSAGKHHIEYRYEPDSAKLGIFIGMGTSSIIILISIILMIAGWRRKKSQDITKL